MIESQAAEFSPVEKIEDSIPEEALSVIEEEERLLATVLESLRKQLASADIRLGVESTRARELTSNIVASRRDVEKQMLASDEAVSHRLRDLKKEEITGIERLIESPYFARIVLQEDDGKGGTKRVEFRLGSAANTECRIIDWRRAPISKLFYEYKEGEEFYEEIQGRERSGTIALRIKVDISDGILRSINCSTGNYRKDDNGRWSISNRRAGSSRSGANYGQLPDVLSLITPEQFRSITEDAKTAILIQGIAGSGKTTVALYRLSWLLNEGNSDISNLIPERETS